MFLVAHLGARVWGGAERAVAHLLAGLQARGHRVLLLCNDPVVATPARAMGVPAEILPLGGDVSVHHALRLAARLRRMKPDVLLVGMFKKVWLAGLAGRMAGVPRIVARVGLQSDVPRNAKYRFAFRRLVDHVVVVAERLAPAYQALPGYGAARVSVIPNAVNVPPRRLPSGSLRASLGIPPDALVVGAIARLATQKRLDRLLDAVARLPEDVHCLVAGEGPCGGALREQAETAGIAARVHFLGYHADVGDVLDAFDVFAVTSAQEGMSNAMLEAMAAGVPVVSTPVSGTEEALREDGDGQAPGLVVDFDVGVIADGLRAVLADPARREAMSRAAARRAAEAFSVPPVLDRWEQVLAGR
jgi:glycosyltransferase involved in cell wall biosynthesis